MIRFFITQEELEAMTDITTTATLDLICATARTVVDAVRKFQVSFDFYAV